MSVEAVGTVRRGRSARCALRQRTDVTMLPALRYRLPFIEPMSPEEVARIDAASMRGAHVRSERYLSCA